MGIMEKQPLLSMVAGRSIGRAGGLKGAELGRLTMISFVIGNPLLSVVAARSMTKKTAKEKTVEQAAPEEPKSDRGSIVKLVAEATGARDEAKLAAVKAGTEAVKSADSAKEAAISATAASDSAKQAALSVPKPV